MKTYCLIGKNLQHSFSKDFFKMKFKNEKIENIKYINIEINDISKLPELIKKNKIAGLNITNPYKKSVIPFLDKINESAKKIGAVNTIKMKKNKLIGYNTDVIGFEKSLTKIIGERKNALILGNGGASKAVKYVLNKLNVNYLIVNRKSKFDYHHITKDILNKYKIIINTTPVGMFPKIEEKPILKYKHLNNSHLLYDLIYNPNETEFLKNGRIQNCDIKNGLEMLYIQAEASWKIWNS
ncbi:MAG: shikimate dehydrogenase [Flavobacteriales bacterium]|nr:shikimate dehydrogenase [Flavobacteriales bacterium]